MRWKWLALAAVFGVVVIAGACVARWRIRLRSGAWLRPHATTPAAPETTPMASEPHGQEPNRLIHEKSPYLLQHAQNPVDWYPWGEEAFAKAKLEDKPVFLSVGYSTCYWCHVMEQESFEDREIARQINERCVPIKVDREERPDIDAIYMSAVTAMTGRGGWPMTVFLTPEGQPFWGATYLPPEDRWGRAGLPTVLQAIGEAWRNQRSEVLRSSQRLTEVLRSAAAPSNPTAQLSLDTLQDAAEQLSRRYDASHGGFGDAPKFPQGHLLSFLLRVWFRNRDARLLDMVEMTLDRMAHGGIHDQLGGGFHRYSTDPVWLVPHFEKMLYDQALLARAYLETYQATGKEQFADVARRIFEYVLQDLRDPGGAFYSAEDAGGVGEEGAFYVWTLREIEAALGHEGAKRFSRFYGVTPEGHVEGKSILHIDQPWEAVAAEEGMSPEEARAWLADARSALLDRRAQRKRPHRDDKVLTDWNGLMIGSLAYGARALDEPRYAEAAKGAAVFVLERLQRDGALLHRYRDGEARVAAFLDDYAFLAWGLTELYEATFEARWLQEARRLTDEMLRLFWDERHGGFLFSGARNEPLIANIRELHDGAMPSGNSVAALNLVRLSALTLDERLRQRAGQWFQSFSGLIAQAPHAFPQGLLALDAWLGPSQEIVIAGDPGSPKTRQMVRAAAGRFLPRAVMLLHPTGGDAEAIEALVPFVKSQQPMDGQPTAYLCERGVCQLPTTSLAQMIARLEAVR